MIITEKRVAIVILNYNGISHLQNYLANVIKNSPEAEVIIADNGSTDGSVKWLKSEYKDLKLIELDKNYGFAEGYNKALEQVKSEYYILLNSDVDVINDWISPMLYYMDAHTNCVACQPKILSKLHPECFEYAGAAGGFIDTYGYPYCRGRILSVLEKDNGQYDDIVEIFWATGAALFIRSDAYWSAGGLDGRFFAHQEEIDLCWRLKARGGSIVCIPDSKVYHVGAGTLGYDSPFKTYLNFRNNAILLYKNISGVRYYYVAFMRMILDWMAALHLMLQGKVSSAINVFRAQISFLKMKSDFRHDRMINASLEVVRKPIGLLNHLLLIEVYLKGRNKYNQFK